MYQSLNLLISTCWRPVAPSCATSRLHRGVPLHHIISIHHYLFYVRIFPSMSLRQWKLCYGFSFSGKYVRAYRILGQTLLSLISGLASPNYRRFCIKVRGFGSYGFSCCITTRRRVSSRKKSKEKAEPSAIRYLATPAFEGHFEKAENNVRSFLGHRVANAVPTCKQKGHYISRVVSLPPQVTFLNHSLLGQRF